MTTVTDSDIKELKTLISEFGQRIESQIKELNIRINEVDKKIIELSGAITNTNTKIDGLDTRIANQEFIYRAVFIAIIGSFTTTVLTVMIRFFWYHPFI